MEQETPQSETERLRLAVEEHTKVMLRHSKLFGDWRYMLLRGIVTGFGGVVGATLVVSITVSVLQPFEVFEGLRPAIEKLTQELNQ